MAGETTAELTIIVATEGVDRGVSKLRRTIISLLRIIF